MVEKVDHAALCRFIYDGESAGPALADLQERWRRAGLRDEMLGCALGRSVDCHQRALIARYRRWSKTRLWAWHGLQSLLAFTKGHEPEGLRSWTCEVVNGDTPKPPCSRGSAPEHDRNVRILRAFETLRAAGFSYNVARQEIGSALKRGTDAYGADRDMPDGTISTAIRRARQLFT